jgi:hypothetical protein
MKVKPEITARKKGIGLGPADGVPEILLDRVGAEGRDRAREKIERSRRAHGWEGTLIRQGGYRSSKAIVPYRY